MNAIEKEIPLVAADLVRAVRALRQAEGSFVDAYGRRMTHDRTAADAQQDLDNAMRDGDWQMRKVTALGAALSGLCLSQMGEQG